LCTSIAINGSNDSGIIFDQQLRGKLAWIAFNAISKNCETQIRIFHESQTGDRYVFLFFEWLSGTHVLTTFFL